MDVEPPSRAIDIKQQPRADEVSADHSAIATERYLISKMKNNESTQQQNALRGAFNGVQKSEYSDVYSAGSTLNDNSLLLKVKPIKQITSEFHN